MRQWSRQWEQTLARLQGPKSTAPSGAHDRELDISQKSTALRASTAALNRIAHSQQHDLGEIQRTLNRPVASVLTRDIGDSSQHGGSTTAHLLLQDITETGRVAELELAHKKEVAKVAHQLRAEIADLRAAHELAEQTAQLQQSEADKHLSLIHI